jgi:hypothetical protein
MKRRRLLRAALWTLAALVVLGAVAIGATVASIEYRCSADVAGNQVPAPAAALPSLVAAPPAGYRRPEVDSFLSYPEWFIVHAYEDLAALLATGNESDFGYRSSVAGYWRSLCRLNRVAAAYGGDQGDTKLMLYTIGFSFTLELAAKGAYETTLGHLAETLRGPRKTAIDLHLAEVAQQYAVFLQRTPWYQFDFGREIGALWQAEAADDDAMIRHWERRLAMSVEFGAKALYAQLIGAAAGSLGPVDRTTLAVFAADTPAVLDAWLETSGAEVIERLAPGQVLVRSERYRPFTHLLLAALDAGVQPVEVAGNRRALVTVLAATDQLPNTRVLFTVPLSAQAPRQRLGINTRMEELHTLLAAVRAAGGQFEHLYDY